MSTFKKAKVTMLPTTRKAKSITSRVDCYGDFSGYYYKEELDGRDTKCFCLNIVLSEKIIATTDISLVKEYNLPQPSQQFIQKYIEEYNKGNIITDVLVEYEDIIYNPEKDREYQSNDRINIEDCDKQTRLKINPKDNTITIKIVKDNWNREEVIELCKQAFIDGTYAGGFGPNEKTIDSETEKWIEENL